MLRRDSGIVVTRSRSYREGQLGAPKPTSDKCNPMLKSMRRTQPELPSVASTEGRNHALRSARQCCDKDAAKFYFNTLSSSGEFSSRATKSGHFEVPSSAPCLHLSARLYWQHLLCAHFLQSLHTPSSFLGPTTGLGGANTLRLGTSTNTGTHSLNWRRRLSRRTTPKGPLQIIISIADQQLSLYDNGAPIARSSVSTGVQGHPTPLGVFSVISKERWHRSNIYSGAPMPYMQRITWSGIALHAGVVPGHPASHGCIRLTNDFAIRLWHLDEARHARDHRTRRCPAG